jgi:A/G-specific adenine glycosylase
MAEFPDVRSLADADSERVLRAWAGLGYYARARNLHAGAKAVVGRGRWPASGAEWREIPGIGEYTAGAIASLAFGQREPILDGNVVRVFSRLLGLDFLPGAGLAEKRVYWGLARHWVAGAGHGDDDGLNPAARAGDLNEGLMELGALVCVPSSPRCEVCPLARACVAYRKGLTASLPPVKPRKKVEVVPAVAVLGRAPEGYLAEMRADGAFLAGHTLFPLLLRSEAQEWRLRFNQMYPQYLIKQESRAAEVRHTIMSSRYHVEVWNVVLSHKARTITPQKTTSAVRLIPEHKIDAILTSAFAKKIWEARKSPAPL